MLEHVTGPEPGKPGAGWRGACGVTRNHAPGGPGSPSSPTTRGRLQWQDATGRKRAKSRRINGTRVLVRPPRMVPGPKIAAVERREARHPAFGMSTKRSWVSQAHLRDVTKFGAPLGAPLPRTLS